MRRICIIILFFLLMGVRQASANTDFSKLVVTNSNAWPPFSFLNDKGEPRGLLIDLWREFGRRNNVEIEFKLVPWEKSLELVRTGQADVQAGLFESGERQKFLDFSSRMQMPLTSRVFVSSKLKVQSISDLGSVVVGMTEKGFAQEFFRTNHPSINVRGFPNSREVVMAAIDEEILAFATDYPAAMYYLHKAGDPGKFRVLDTLYTKQLQAAVRDGNIQMLIFISEGFSKIPPEEIDRITQKWMHSVQTTPEGLYKWLFGGLVALILVFVVVYIVGLRRQVKLRTLELERLSQTDMLTGLYNRMKIEDILDNELYRAQRYDQSLSLIMLDIDFFKQVNDTFGHVTGDEVLIALAKLLQENVRRSDAVGRWGGEEFMIICPETDEESSAALAENLRRTIEEFEFKSVKHCTSSFGVTEYLPGDDVGKLFERSDMALYKSKVDGRNRVTIG